MTEYETYEIVISLLNYAHTLGEAVLLQSQFWVGVSFTLIVVAFIAPQRLTTGVAAYLLFVYVTFTGATVLNVSADVTKYEHAAVQARNILATNVNSALKLLPQERLQTGVLSARLSMVYFCALFLGVIGYVSITARETHIANKRKDPD